MECVYNCKEGENMDINGTIVNYYFHCKTQLWLFSQMNVYAILKINPDLAQSMLLATGIDVWIMQKESILSVWEMMID